MSQGSPRRPDPRRSSAAGPLDLGWPHLPPHLSDGPSSWQRRHALALTLTDPRHDVDTVLAVIDQYRDRWGRGELRAALAYAHRTVPLPPAAAAEYRLLVVGAALRGAA